MTRFSGIFFVAFLGVVLPGAVYGGIEFDSANVGNIFTNSELVGCDALPSLNGRALPAGTKAPISPSRPTPEGLGQLAGKTLQIAVIRLTFEITSDGA